MRNFHPVPFNIKLVNGYNLNLSAYRKSSSLVVIIRHSIERFFEIIKNV